MDHSSRALPPLDTLHAFDIAARTGSFSAAAERLHLTHGAISRQIAKLENWLGFKVFERGARGVSLTIEGNRLFYRTSEAFALIADNTDRWSEPRGAAVVRLASIPSICGLWLIPRLTKLESGDPPLRVVLDAPPLSGVASSQCGIDATRAANAPPAPMPAGEIAGDCRRLASDFLPFYPMNSKGDMRL